MKNKLFQQRTIDSICCLRYDFSDELSMQRYSEPNYVLEFCDAEAERSNRKVALNKFIYQYLGSFSSFIIRHSDYFLNDVNALLHTNITDPNEIISLPLELDDVGFSKLQEYFQRHFVETIIVDDDFQDKYVYRLNPHFWMGRNRTGLDNYIDVLHNHDIPTLVKFRTYETFTDCFIGALLAIEGSGQNNSTIAEIVSDAIERQLQHSTQTFTTSELSIFKNHFQLMTRNDLFAVNGCHLKEDSYVETITSIKDKQLDLVNTVISFMEKLPDPIFEITKVNCA